MAPPIQLEAMHLFSTMLAIQLSKQAERLTGNEKPLLKYVSSRG
jgi:hypothetical protein